MNLLDFHSILRVPKSIAYFISVCFVWFIYAVLGAAMSCYCPAHCLSFSFTHSFVRSFVRSF